MSALRCLTHLMLRSRWFMAADGHLLLYSTLAGSVAYKHVLPDGYSTKDAHRANLYLVTAAVDRIDMLRPIDAGHPENLRLSGHVSYTGSSALEVLVRLDSISRWRGLESDPQAILVARFTMACRDTKTGKAKKIPALVPESSDERALFEMGRKQKERKKEMLGQSLEMQPPNAEEAAKLHNLFVNRQDLYSAFQSLASAGKPCKPRLTRELVSPFRSENNATRLDGVDGRDRIDHLDSGASTRAQRPRKDFWWIVSSPPRRFHRDTLCHS